MRGRTEADTYAQLANQSLRRPLAPAERALAHALDAIFERGEHDFDAVAALLQRDSVRRPSGADGPWTAQVLDEELRRINVSLDAAYAQRGQAAVQHGWSPAHED